MKPILFNTDMVRAILDGRKTVTRRLIKPHFRPEECSFQIITEKHSGKYVRIEYLDEYEDVTRHMNEPYRPGDILYIREAWAFDTGDEGDEIGTGSFAYRADGSHSPNGKWRPSIHMPKEAARIFLRVNGVRAERLQDIGTDETVDEGAVKKPHYVRYGGEKCLALHERYRHEFADLWDSTITPAELETYGWNANPWVWVIEFERIDEKDARRDDDVH